MNWIGEWCNQRCHEDKRCDTCSETCTPRFRLADAVGCSEYLIWILMNEANAKTHPEFADAIADFTKATPQQRDSIVAEKHRGTYVPNYNREFDVRKRESGLAWNAKEVVAVDRVGFVIRRYKTMKDAAAQIGCTASSIGIRCNKYNKVKDEFKPYGMTFRFADEWDVMTIEERRADLESMKVRI